MTTRPTRMLLPLAAIIATASAAACIPAEPAPTAPPAPVAQHHGPPGAHAPAHAPTHEPAPPAPAPAPAAPEPAPEPTPAPSPAPSPEPSVDPMRVLEAEIVAAMNQLRKSPKAFASEIRTYRSYYRDGLIHFPGREVPVMTNEGVAAVDEAIKAATEASPAKTLVVSPGLSRAAREHAIEIGNAGNINHRSADGSQPHHRMERYGTIIGYSGENIGTGDTSGLHMVVGLFVDDGVPSRGHRTNLLTKAFGKVGVGCHPHKRWEIVCVIDYAEGFREKR